jgi:hypothetical protein
VGRGNHDYKSRAEYGGTFMSELKKIDEQKKKNNIKEDPPDDMEEFMDFHVHEPINKSDSVFDKNSFNRTGGINTMPSVFDKSLF